MVEIQSIINEHPDNYNYGVDRICTVLKSKNIKCSRSTVYRIMKYSNLLHYKRKPHGITKATDETQERENIIKRDFTADKPVTKLLTDITEVHCSNGKLYISAVLDCFNGEIISLEMRDNMKKELCIDTVQQLKQKYGNLTGIILHSDRGSQYTSSAFRSTLLQYGMIQSLSSSGKCYDNARMESFFATLKKEKIYRMPTYKMTKEQVKTAVFRYVFAYYNTIRVTSFNPDGLPPVKYRERLSKKAA